MNDVDVQTSDVESSAVDADLRRAFISALAEMLWKESEDKK